MPIEKNGFTNPDSKNDSLIKEKIITPESVAEQSFDDCINSPYEKFTGLRMKLITLQSPGESFIDSSSQSAQLYEAPSSDEWRGGFSYNTNITTYYLVVGAKKKEVSNWAGSYNGGSHFSISSGEDTKMPQGTSEQFRTAYIASARKDIKKEFEHAKQKIKAPENLFNKEEWIKRYETHWDEMQNAIESKWKAEDDLLLIEKEEAWKQYENIVKDLKEARQEVEQAERLARVSRVALNVLEKPSWGDAGADTIEEIQTETIALRAYASKIKEDIPNEIKKREKEFQNIEDEERFKKEVEESEIKHFGVSGKLLDTARSLATDAEQKLGLVGAQRLFKDTLEAPYGRWKRQEDIKRSLGEDLPEIAHVFYGLITARDADAVMGAALRILSEKQKTGSVSKATSESTESKSTPVEIKIEELPRLDPPDKKDWFHLSNRVKHFNKLNKEEKEKYNAGERVEVQCSLCNSLVGYLQK